jgi:Ca2+-binding EF-hand superfamily protein
LEEYSRFCAYPPSKLYVAEMATAKANSKGKSKSKSKQTSKKNDEDRNENKARKGWLPTIVSTILRVPKRNSEEGVTIGKKELLEFRKLYFNSSERITFLSIFQEMVDASHQKRPEISNQITQVKSTASSDASKPNSVDNKSKTSPNQLIGAPSVPSKVTYKGFLLYFQITSDLWMKRLFEVINFSCSGSISFIEFIQFCNRFLLVDKSLTNELCFRLLSRRGVNFQREYSILDLQDIQTFITNRYSHEIKQLPKQHKFALDLFTYIDKDEDGGISFQELISFNERNPVFLRLTHSIQSHLRNCIFSNEFWVERSRTVKMYNLENGLMDVINLITGINKESEDFVSVHVKDPVVDVKGNALKSADIEKFLRQRRIQREQEKAEQGIAVDRKEKTAQSSESKDQTPETANDIASGRLTLLINIS